jgi:hypothetical protein
MKDIAQFPARESTTVASITLTRESALLLLELLRKSAMPLESARHALPLLDQVTKVVSTFSPEHPDGS